MLETTFEQILTQLSKPAVRALMKKSTVWMNSTHEAEKRYFRCMALVQSLFELLKR
ncbi:hypothetical protein IGK86_000961 [Enterococcus sp. DIV1206]